MRSYTAPVLGEGISRGVRTHITLTYGTCRIHANPKSFMGVRAVVKVAMSSVERVGNLAHFELFNMDNTIF